MGVTLINRLIKYGAVAGAGGLSSEDKLVLVLMEF